MTSRSRLGRRQAAFVVAAGAAVGVVAFAGVALGAKAAADDRCGTPTAAGVRASEACAVLPVAWPVAGIAGLGAGAASGLAAAGMARRQNT